MNNNLESFSSEYSPDSGMNITDKTKVELPANMHLKYIKQLQLYLPTPTEWVSEFEEGEPHKGTRSPMRIVTLSDHQIEGGYTFRKFRDFQTGVFIRADINKSVEKGIRGSQIIYDIHTQELRTGKKFLGTTQRSFELIKSGPFTISRRFGEVNQGEGVMGFGLAPYKIATIDEDIVNRNTGTIYSLHFRTPFELWPQNEELGRAIVEKKILSEDL